jgi:hypothetical protein
VLTHNAYFDKYYPTYFSNVNLIYPEEVFELPIPNQVLIFCPGNLEFIAKGLLTKVS